MATLNHDMIDTLEAVYDNGRHRVYRVTYFGGAVRHAVLRGNALVATTRTYGSAIERVQHEER